MGIDSAMIPDLRKQEKFGKETLPSNVKWVKRYHEAQSYKE